MEFGAGMDAARQRETVLVGRSSAAAEADARLQSILRSAHEASVRHAQRLGVIERAVNDAVSQQSSLDLDTTAGVVAFQRFLLAKHKEILAVVEDARSADVALEAQVRALSGYQL